VRAGYRIVPWVAGELAYENVGELDVGGAEVDLQSLFAQVKLYPLTGRIQPYALGGAGWARADFDRGAVEDLDETEPSFRVGAGIDLYVLRSFPLFAEVAYTWPTGDLDELQYWTGSIGAVFRF